MEATAIVVCVNIGKHGDPQSSIIEEDVRKDDHGASPSLIDEYVERGDHCASPSLILKEGVRACNNGAPPS